MSNKCTLENLLQQIRPRFLNHNIESHHGLVRHVECDEIIITNILLSIPYYVFCDTLFLLICFVKRIEIHRLHKSGLSWSHCSIIPADVSSMYFLCGLVLHQTVERKLRTLLSKAVYSWQTNNSMMLAYDYQEHWHLQCRSDNIWGGTFSITSPSHVTRLFYLHNMMCERYGSAVYQVCCCYSGPCCLHNSKYLLETDYRPPPFDLQQIGRSLESHVGTSEHGTSINKIYFATLKSGRQVGRIHKLLLILTKESMDIELREVK